MDEISVLDYLKFKLNPKNFGKEILPAENPEFISGERTDGAEADERRSATRLEQWLSDRKTDAPALNPLFLVLSLFFALAAQIVLEPTIVGRTRLTPRIGGGIYVLSALCFLFAVIARKGIDGDPDEDGEEEVPGTLQEEGPLSETGMTDELLPVSDAAVPDGIPEEITMPDPDPVAPKQDPPVFVSGVRYEFLCLSAVCALLAFLLFGGNRFTVVNLAVWILSLIFGGLAFCSVDFRELTGRCRNWFSGIAGRKFRLCFGISAWNLLWLAVLGCCSFFLFYRLDSVPMDMVSDHAEKLYDIKDILDGKSPIFFTRNTGRECFQFYFTALIIKIFGTGLSFLSLKIGTALAGLFILPFVYKLGKLLWNRRAGLLAMLLCGISYWPVVIGRAALRFSYYPMFTAPALYFLIRGLKERSRSSLILSGIFLGIGLHGYSPFRIVPIAFVILFLVYLLTDVKPGKRMNAVRAFLCLIFFAFLIFLPLLRVTLDMPEMVMNRSLSRIGETEKSFDSAPMGIFLSNVWKGIVMPFWNDGSTWVHSIVGRPALEHLTASFFFLGILFTLLRIFRERRWEDICMILAVPLMMLPSTLSLAFPMENPCLNRTAGALIPVMVIAAAGICCTFDVFTRALRDGKAFIVLCVLSCLFLANIISHNYELIFRQYAYEYDRSAWNTSQIGKVIRGFADSAGSYEDAYVIPYPHWVDTRLVGINAGDPGKDYSFDKSLVASLPDDGHPRLFIYRESDTEGADAVRCRFPHGVEQLHTGPYTGKNFYSYITLSTPGAE